MRKKYLIEFAIVVSILLGAAFLRFANIEEQGVLFWDEGMYLNEARFYASVAEHFPDIVRDVFAGNSLAKYMETLEGWLPSAGKPLHGLLIYLLSCGLGLHEYTGQILSGITNLLFLVLFYRMVRRWSGVPEALITLYLLALSPFQVLFSRSCFPEMNSQLFLYAALYCYAYYHESKQRTHVRWLIVSGVLYGLSLVTNYRWVITIPVFFLCEFGFAQGGFSKRFWTSVKQMALFACGVLAIVVLFDLPYIFIAKSVQLSAEFSSYHTQAVFYFSELFQRYGWSLISFRPLYPYLFVFFNGIIITFALLFGTYALCKQKRKSVFQVSMMTLFYLIFIALIFIKKGYFARYNSIVYPAATYIAAYGMCRFAMWCVRAPDARIILCAIIVFSAGSMQVAHSREYTTVSSGYRDARDYLVAHNGERCLSYMNSVFEFYFGRNVAERLYGGEKDLVSKVSSGMYDYIVIDYGQFSTRANRFLFADTFLREHCMPVFTVENAAGQRREIVLENLRRQHETEYRFDTLMKDTYVDVIRIYRVADVYDALLKEGYIEA